MMMFRVLLSVALFVITTAAAAAVVEEVLELPVTVKTIYDRAQTQTIKVTSWRDDARDKSPFLIFNHGRPASPDAFAKMGRQRYSDNAQYFVSLGFAVLVPTRVGYGVSGG